MPFELKKTTTARFTMLFSVSPNHYYDNLYLSGIFIGRLVSFSIFYSLSSKKAKNNSPLKLSNSTCTIHCIIS